MKVLVVGVFDDGYGDGDQIYAIFSEDQRADAEAYIQEYGAWLEIEEFELNPDWRKEKAEEEERRRKAREENQKRFIAITEANKDQFYVEDMLKQANVIQHKNGWFWEVVPK